MKNRAKMAGFTLVELSIVLVIIGFLVAGISAGSGLVKQAQIRSVVSDLVGFQSSYNGFLNRYSKTPGDMDIASAYWPGVGVCAATAVNCNGNGDGIIQFATGARGNGTGDETERAWKHLVLSGFIGQGIAEIADTFSQTQVGINSPSSRVSGAGYMIGSGTIGTGVTSPFAAGVNAIFLGKNNTNNSPVAGAIKPEDAFNIDVKVDDGAVNGTSFQGNSTGFFRAINGAGGANCISGGNYNIASTDADCLSGLSLN